MRGPKIMPRQPRATRVALARPLSGLSILAMGTASSDHSQFARKTPHTGGAAKGAPAGGRWSPPEEHVTEIALMFLVAAELMGQRGMGMSSARQSAGDAQSVRWGLILLVLAALSFMLAAWGAGGKEGEVCLDERLSVPSVLRSRRVQENAGFRTLLVVPIR